VSDPTVSFGSRLQALLGWSKPYLDIIGLATSFVFALSAAIAWVVAHFVTRGEAFFLECRLNNQFTKLINQANVSIIQAKLDARNSLLEELALQNVTGVPMKQLTDEVQQLNKELDDKETANTEAENKQTVKCESPVDNKLIEK
jgi:hypothetical protein